MDPIAQKTYYSIGEVSKITELKQHVLRYWETQFDKIAPAKNRGGSRVYRRGDIEAILLIKHLLYEKRFTIEGAKQKLKEMRKEGELKAERKLHAEPALLASIKDGLHRVQDLLTLPEGKGVSDGGV